jgi:hypothetical protein
MSLSGSELPFPENVNLFDVELLNGENRPESDIPGRHSCEGHRCNKSDHSHFKRTLLIPVRWCGKRRIGSLGYFARRQVGGRGLPGIAQRPHKVIERTQVIIMHRV